MVSWNAIATGNCSVFTKNKEPLMDDYRKFVEKNLADMDYLEEKSKSLWTTWKRKVSPCR